MRISRDDLILIFQEFGFDAAAKWSKAKMAARLKELVGLAKEGGVGEISSSRLNGIWQAILARDGDVELVASGPSDIGDPKPESKSVLAAKDPEEAVEKCDASVEPEEPDRAERGPARLYIAGRIWAERGLDATIDDDMVADLQQRYGKGNRKITRWALTSARAVIRGYLADE